MHEMLSLDFANGFELNWRPDMSRISIRFFIEEVCAIWNDGTGKWFFSVLDVGRVLSGQGRNTAKAC